MAGLSIWIRDRFLGGKTSRTLPKNGKPGNAGAWDVVGRLILDAILGAFHDTETPIYSH